MPRINSFSHYTPSSSPLQLTLTDRVTGRRNTVPVPELASEIPDSFPFLPLRTLILARRNPSHTERQYVGAPADSLN